MNRFKYTAAALAVAMAPMFAHASDAQGNPTGPYVGGAVGQFNLNIKHLDDVDDAVQSIRKSDDNAWKIFAGYRFLPYLGVEAAYIDLGHAKDGFSSAGSNGNYSVRMKGFAPSLIATLPVGPVELFAKVGQYYYDVDTHINLDSPGPNVTSSQSRSDLLYGGGVSLVVAQHVELRAEYEKIEIEHARDSDAFWLGAAWRF